MGPGVEAGTDVNGLRHLTCDDCPRYDPYGAERPVLPHLLRFFALAILSVVAYVGLLLAAAVWL